MTDHDFETSAIRYETVRLARSLIGSHYLKGTAGATPGNEDGVWYKQGEVTLHANETTLNPRRKWT